MNKNKEKTPKLFDGELELRSKVVEDLREQMQQYQEDTLKTYTAEEVIRNLKLEHHGEV